MIKYPCMTCENRRPACHDTCETLREFKAKLKRSAGSRLIVRYVEKNTENTKGSIPAGIMAN